MTKWRSCARDGAKIAAPSVILVMHSACLSPKTLLAVGGHHRFRSVVKRSVFARWKEKIVNLHEVAHDVALHKLMPSNEPLLLTPTNSLNPYFDVWTRSAPLGKAQVLCCETSVEPACILPSWTSRHRHTCKHTETSFVSRGGFHAPRMRRRTSRRRCSWWP